MKRILLTLISWAGFARVFYGGRGFGAGKAHQNRHRSIYEQAPNHPQRPNTRTTAMARKSYLSLLTLNTVALLLLGGASNIYAQPPDTLWTHAYNWTGDQSILGAAEGNNGNSILVGYSDYLTQGGVDALILVVDEDGTVEDSLVLGDTQDDEFTSIDKTMSRNYYAAGVITSPVTMRSAPYIVHIDSNCSYDWSRVYESGFVDVVSDVESTSDGGFILCGGSNRGFPYGRQSFAIRGDSVGDTLWARFYEQPMNLNTQAFDIEQTSDGGFIMVGERLSIAPPRQDSYVSRLDSLGDTLWTTILDTTRIEQIVVVRETSERAFVVAGHSESSDHSRQYVFWAKLDSLGTVIVERQFEHASTAQVALAATLNDEDELIVGGFERSTTPEGQFCFLMKIGQSGDTIWTQAFPYEDRGAANALVQLEDNSYLLAGTLGSSLPGEGNAYAIRTQPDWDSGVIRQPLPTDRIVYSAYPNPFNNYATISISLSKPSNIRLAIYNSLGCCVNIVHEGWVPVGQRTFRFDASGYASGLYFVTIRAAGHNSSRKIVYIK